MTDNFMESKTKENLMRAFAGESQARNRYTIAAEHARHAGMNTIADIFTYTAEQERAHGERFYELLKNASGETIFIDGGYPVDLQESLPELMRAAAHNEREEHEKIYPAFAEIAKKEGFFEAASAFMQIAEIEHAHEKRFAAVAKLLEENRYFSSEEPAKWICTNCGHIHEGKQAPKVCPVCHYEQGYFLPYTMAPYSVKGDLW